MSTFNIVFSTANTDLLWPFLSVNTIPQRSVCKACTCKPVLFFNDCTFVRNILVQLINLQGFLIMSCMFSSSQTIQVYFVWCKFNLNVNMYFANWEVLYIVEVNNDKSILIGAHLATCEPFVMLCPVYTQLWRSQVSKILQWIIGHCKYCILRLWVQNLQIVTPFSCFFCNVLPVFSPPSGHVVVWRFMCAAVRL